jgi:ABC-type glycerol-3-phosphate transport system substrate-binding protein
VDGSYAKTMIEQATNTELEIIQVPTKELDNKLNILLASGDRPDIIQCETETMESQLLSAGILLPINEYWDNYPNIKNGRDEATWDLMRYTDGNIYSIGIKNIDLLHGDRVLQYQDLFKTGIHDFTDS